MRYTNTRVLYFCLRYTAIAVVTFITVAFLLLNPRRRGLCASALSICLSVRWFVHRSPETRIGGRGPKGVPYVFSPVKNAPPREISDCGVGLLVASTSAPHLLFSAHR